MTILFALGRLLAMTTDWPNWNDGDEFRAVRDRIRPSGK